MDFLVCAPMPTFPLDVGNKKGFHAFCKGLERHGRVHFVLYAAEGEWREGIDPFVLRGMQEQWDTLHVVTPTRPVHTHAIGKDHTADEWWDDALGEHLKWRFERFQYDAFVVKYTWLSKALTFAPPTTRKVLFTADRFSNRREIFENKGLTAEFYHMSVEEEAVALARTDIVIAMKQEEQDFFETITSNTVVTIPHCEPDIAVPAAPARTEPVIRFGVVGANNTINRENLLAFLEVATPIFGAHFAPLEIVVGGSICESIAELKHPFVRLAGYVDDIRDFYGQIDVSLIPIEFSTGIKIKFGEALAAGFPTLSTAHGSEGYEPVAALHRLADFEQMALACVDLALDPGRIEPLRVQSCEERDRLKQRFNACMDDLGRRIRLSNPAGMLIPGRDLADVSTTDFSRLLDLWTPLRGALRLDVHLLPGTRINLRGIRRIASMGQVYVLGPDGPDGLDIVEREADPSVMALLRPSWVSATAKAAGAVVLAWDECLADILTHVEGPVLVNGDDAQVAAGAEVLAELGGATQDIAVFATTRRLATATTFSDNIHDRIITPYFWRHTTPVVRRWSDRNGQEKLVHLLCSDRSVGLGTGIARAIQAVYPDARVVLLRTERCEDGQVNASDIVHRRRSPGPRPLLVADLDPGETGFAILRELYRRSHVPIIAAAPANGSAMAADNAALPVVRTVAGLIEHALACLRDPAVATRLTQAAAHDAHVAYSEHAGWASIWKRLNTAGTSRIWLNQ